MEKEQSTYLQFTTLLLVLFIALKLCRVINWSWWWVLSPFWIPLAFALVVFIAFKLFEKPSMKDLGEKSPFQVRLEEIEEKRRQLERMKKQAKEHKGN